MTIRSLFPSLALAALLGGGCSDASSSGSPEAGAATCAVEEGAMPYSAGLSLTGKSGIVKTTLMSSDPAPPFKGDNTWMVKVTDVGSGAALDNVKLEATPFMPKHGHGSPVKVVVTSMGGGAYQLKPVNLFMAGVWQVTLTVTTADSKTDQTVFAFCIEG